MTKLTPTILVILLIIQMPAYGQGPSSRIYLNAPGLAVEIADEQARYDFRFGSGPGNYMNGMPSWKPRSWIIEDWTRPVAEPDKSLLRVKATFSLDRGRGPRGW